jgi:TPR repeat protein
MKPQQIVDLALEYFHGKEGDPYGLRGYQHSQDYTKAFELFQEAAKKRKSVAYYYLGVMYRDGKGTEKDYDQAKEWFTRAEKLEHINAFSALKTLEHMVGAENGEPEAMHKLAEAYQYGNGVSDDIEEAIRWYKAAAEKGHPESQSSLGFIYHHGFKVSKDIAQAIHWYELAAAQGSSSAMYGLGCIYLKGEVVEKDIELAEKYLSSSHYFNESNLLNIIGLMKASESGDLKACRDLAFEYATTEALGYDWSEAARLLKKAIEPKKITPEFKTIADFIIAHNDHPSAKDYKIYKPSWHQHPVSFCFTPPIDEDEEDDYDDYDEEESYPYVSGAMVLIDDGIIVVEEYNSGEYYLLDECQGDSIDNAVHAIETYKEN